VKRRAATSLAPHSHQSPSLPPMVELEVKVPARKAELVRLVLILPHDESGVNCR
jgi:hypothetical protein